MQPFSEGEKTLRNLSKATGVKETRQVEKKMAALHHRIILNIKHQKLRISVLEWRCFHSKMFLLKMLANGFLFYLNILSSIEDDFLVLSRVKFKDPQYPDDFVFKAVLLSGAK